jgi:hypothetical protein
LNLPQTPDLVSLLEIFAKLHKTINFVIPANPGSMSGAGAGIHPAAVIPAKAGI